VLAQGEIAIEIKGSSRIDRKDMNGLDAFTQACSPKRSIVVCNEKERRIHGKIEILPWEIFLQHLWDGEIL
jgi:hypothetical protein